MSRDAVDGDEIAAVVLKNFETWEKKRKPGSERADGAREWVPLSGIVAQSEHELNCLAAATGMKCLPQKDVPEAKGIVLHDWHAEMLAIRSLNRFLLEECHALALDKKAFSKYVRWRDEQERTESHFQPFALHDGINLHMYCSEAPCGDASMELTMASQEDATPWSIPAVSDTLKSSSSDKSVFIKEPVLHGRSYFSELGIVRRKPSRPDAPPSLSKSCSDKLALKQCTSLLSAITSLFISPENMYIHSMILPSSQLSETATLRAFSPTGRLAPLAGKSWAGGYAFRPFRVVSTSREFSFSRRSAHKVLPSPISTSWTPNGAETLVKGILQGRRRGDMRGATKVCNKKMWKLAIQVAVAAEVRFLKQIFMAPPSMDGTPYNYGNVKANVLFDERRRVKKDSRDVLGGWVRNVGDENFDSVMPGDP